MSPRNKFSTGRKTDPYKLAQQRESRRQKKLYGGGAKPARARKSKNAGCTSLVACVVVLALLGIAVVALLI